MAYGSYYGFSPGGFLSEIDAVFLFWMVMFLIVFFLANKALTKWFRNQRAIGTVIAFVFTSLAIFWTSKQYSLNSNFLGLGYFINNISVLYPWILLIIAVLVIWWRGFGPLFVLYGSLILIATVLFGLVYEKGIAIALGIFLILIGIPLWRKSNRRRKFNKLAYDKQWDVKTKKAVIRADKRARRGRRWNRVKNAGGWFGRNAKI